MRVFRRYMYLYTFVQYIYDATFFIAPNLCIGLKKLTKVAKSVLFCRTTSLKWKPVFWIFLAKLMRCTKLPTFLDSYKSLKLTEFFRWYMYCMLLSCFHKFKSTCVHCVLGSSDFSRSFTHLLKRHGILCSMYLMFFLFWFVADELDFLCFKGKKRITMGK
jgi:hypothetical protein